MIYLWKEKVLAVVKMITLLIIFVILSIIGFLLWLFGKGHETVFAGFALIGALCIVIPSIIQSTSLSYGLIPTRNFIDGQLFYQKIEQEHPHFKFRLRN